MMQVVVVINSKIGKEKVCGKPSLYPAVWELLAVALLAVWLGEFHPIAGQRDLIEEP